MKLRSRLPLNIQFFAEGEGGDIGASSTDGVDVGQDEGIDEQAQEHPKAFDQILSDKAYQAEFDRRVEKALETAKGKWETDHNQKLEDAKTEAAKLAKMNADEKAQYEKEKSEADFSKRLADLTARELKAEAKETLVGEGLPVELSEVLNYTDAESCKKSIEAVKKAFQSSVEKAVNEKLRGDGPPKAASTSLNTLQNQIAKAIRGNV